MLIENKHFIMFKLFRGKNYAQGIWLISKCLLFQAKFYSGEQSKDSYNGETFGSPDNLSRGRSEEEKLRRGKIFSFSYGFFSGGFMTLLLSYLWFQSVKI